MNPNSFHKLTRQQEIQFPFQGSAECSHKASTCLQVPCGNHIKWVLARGLNDCHVVGHYAYLLTLKDKGSGWQFLDFPVTWEFFNAKFEGIGGFDDPISHLASHCASCLFSFHVLAFSLCHSLHSWLCCYIGSQIVLLTMLPGQSASFNKLRGTVRIAMNCEYFVSDPSITKSLLMKGNWI